MCFGGARLFQPREFVFSFVGASRCKFCPFVDASWVAERLGYTQFLCETKVTISPPLLVCVSSFEYGPFNVWVWSMLSLLQAVA